VTGDQSSAAALMLRLGIFLRWWRWRPYKSPTTSVASMAASLRCSRASGIPRVATKDRRRPRTARQSMAGLLTGQTHVSAPDGLGCGQRPGSSLGKCHHHYQAGVGFGQDRSFDGGVQCYRAHVYKSVVASSTDICHLDKVAECSLFFSLCPTTRPVMLMSTNLNRSRVGALFRPWRSCRRQDEHPREGP
jgi:hypothetical protein